jgi:flagellar protein FlaF
VAKQTAGPRELEANLLLNAAARLQAVKDGREVQKGAFDAALTFNRRLWSIFLAAVTSNDNPLPPPIKQNVANLGVFVMTHTLAVSADRRADGLGSLITINRELAAGLLSRG